LVDTSVHTPVQHSSSAPHTFPHAPQFEVVSTVVHVPEQQRCEPVQEGPPPQRHSPMTQTSPAAQGSVQGIVLVQDPSIHISPVGHMASQLPQFIASSSTSMQVSPQHARPPPQAGAEPQRHAPSTHVSPGAHGAGHGGATQSPSMHIAPAAQRLPQEPQLSTLSARFTHAAPQHVSPVAHAEPLPHWQVPDAHMFPSGAQVFPHEPHSKGSRSVLTHAPSQHVPVAQTPSGGHAGRHRPSRHTCEGPHAGEQSPPPPVSVGTNVSIGGVPESSVRDPWAHPTGITKRRSAKTRITKLPRSANRYL
jgi:hypothetical protein